MKNNHKDDCAEGLILTAVVVKRWAVSMSSLTKSLRGAKDDAKEFPGGSGNLWRQGQDGGLGGVFNGGVSLKGESCLPLIHP